MNKYLIDPAWFYWLQIANNLKIFLIIISVLSIICFIMTLVMSKCDPDVFWNKESEYFMPIFNKAIKILFICFFASTSINIFIPNSKTLIKMKIAEKITYKNIDKIKNNFEHIFKNLNNKRK